MAQKQSKLKVPDGAVCIICDKPFSVEYRERDWIGRLDTDEHRYGNIPDTGCRINRYGYFHCRHPKDCARFLVGFKLREKEQS